MWCELPFAGNLSSVRYGSLFPAQPNLMKVCYILNNRPSSLFNVVASMAMSELSVQTKTAPEGAAFDYLLYSYIRLRLANPIC